MTKMMFLSLKDFNKSGLFSDIIRARARDLQGPYCFSHDYFLFYLFFFVPNDRIFREGCGKAGLDRPTRPSIQFPELLWLRRRRRKTTSPSCR